VNYLTHINPDGDAIGAVFACYEARKAIGLEGNVYLYGDLPRWFQEVWELLGSPPYYHNVPLDGGKCWLLDAPSLSRCGPMVTNQTIAYLIDHHPIDQATWKSAAEAYADAYVNEEASSTCEMLYRLMTKHGKSVKTSVAHWLSLGMRTDTLNFTTDKVSSGTFEIMACLVDEIDIQVASIIHRSLTTNLIRFHTHVLALDSFAREDTYIIRVSRVNQKAYGVNENDCKMLIEVPGRAKDIDLTVLIIETSTGTNVSARSKSSRAQELCIKLGGGGHPKASGARTALSLDDATDEVLRLL
jgi:phosphoesterase RecJ-like protein